MKCFNHMHSTLNHLSQICLKTGSNVNKELLRSTEIHDPQGHVSVQETGAFAYFGKGSIRFNDWIKTVQLSRIADRETYSEHIQPEEMTLCWIL